MSIIEVIKYDAAEAFDKLILAEIAAQPDNEEFLLGVQKSAFFKQLFEGGFTAGILWAKKHEKSKFVSDGPQL